MVDYGKKLKFRKMKVVAYGCFMKSDIEKLAEEIKKQGKVAVVYFDLVKVVGTDRVQVNLV